MTVDHFWKRVPAEAIVGFGADKLSAIVPHRFDDRFAAERDAGILVGVEDTGDLIGALLSAGAAGTPDEATASLFTEEPDDWDDGYLVGTRPADEVRQLARLLATAPLEQWLEQHRAELAIDARTLGYPRPFDADGAAQLLDDLPDLIALFEAAAAAREVVVLKRIS